MPEKENNTSPSTTAAVASGAAVDIEEDNSAPSNAAAMLTIVSTATEDVTADTEAIYAEEKKDESPERMKSDQTLSTDAETRDASSKELEAVPSKDEGAAASDALKDKELGSDEAPKEMELSGEDQAGLISSWFLLYLTPLLKLGATKVLDSSDVGPPSKCDRAKECYDSVNEQWVVEVARTKKVNEVQRLKHQAKLDALPPNATKKRAKMGAFKPASPNLAMVLWRSFGFWRVWYAIFLYVISALLQFMPVLILNDLVRYFETPNQDEFQALLFNPWGDVVGLFVFPFIVSLFQTRSQVILNHCAIYIRTSVSTLLFSKALTISAAGRAQTSTGQVVNMMSNDTTQLQRFLQFFGFTLIAPIQIVISLVLIYRQVGNATWVGVAFMFLLVPINGVVFSNVSKMRRKVLKYSDARVKMINEILAGIRIIKFYAWEVPFGKEVQRLRDKELKALTTLAYTTAIGFSLIMLSAPIINPILVFLSYINISGNSLDAATAFTTIALFNIMRFPFAFLPMGFLQFVQSKIALRRLSKYLELSELTSYIVPELPDNMRNNDKDEDVLCIEDDDKPSDPAVVINKGTFSWVDPDATPAPIEPAKKKRMSRKERKESKRKLMEEEKRASQGSDLDSSKRNESTNSLNRSESLASLGISTMKLDAENDAPESRIALRDISCTIERGSLVAVVGTVGSGKSSFLAAILGEMESINDTKVYMPPKKGELLHENNVSFCSQSPWVVNDTLRGNILFGRPFDKSRYEQVVRSCALTDDLAVLPAGDMTEIGERGINLSGGQKARVALARAMYSPDSQLILMDDPLSAVDAHVGEHLFREAITGDICRGATRVLVTHHVHFLPRCDSVIVLEKGMVKHTGKYEDLVARGVDFAGAIEATKKDDSVGADDKETEGEKDEAKSGNQGDDKDSKGEEVSSKDNAKMKKAGEKLVTDEEKEEGAVEGSMYSHYAKAGGTLMFLSIFIIQGIGRASEIMANFWLTIWAEATMKSVVNETTIDTVFYLNIYAAFGLFGVLCLTLRSISMAIHRLKASRRLHDDLTASIMRAPVAFFDVTPIGRVLNRFAADMDKIDLELTQSLGQAVSTIYSVLGAVSAIIAATKGTLLVALAPIGYFNYIIQKWFRKSSTELQRAASVAASPIFTDFSQMLSGTSTIRAYGKQNKFFGKCQSSFDNFNALFSAIQQANFWLGLRLDAMGGSVGAIIGGIALATNESNFIPAGWVGLALSYSIEVTGYLKHGVRMIAQCEAEMNSVERVLYYSNSVQPEAPSDTKLDPNLSDWPSKGSLEIQRVSMRYRDGPLVLKGINVSIKGGEKIGVVGRTGSGKSSLMTALFRICEVEPDGGKIVIDGVDISQIGLNALRLSLSIIPQDPVMFSNTVRYNLDPFEEKSEYELWEALKKVQLAEAIAVMPGGLDEQVSEGGENFSQGQRQLLCIARSLLRKPKILVMDEATASIDNATDALIQQMIRENFASATVLTIAHRLNTIMDSDRVLVLDDGNVAEFDSPAALMNQDGIFASMVEKSKNAHDA
eukprot:CAMPEP_0183704094 /NCGR_PEP_ID=MMETSP0737-20130205/1557_1 /TAXON_ID=385413 /ORGANISM="Thalassiosira miniscula, Strain CCMP1093" /LENGTH=1530 /DNA_ID=CAMNT_0025930911 /DNA_START=209 /DNA_END=4801 /DNA_ORIENTATION=-